VPGRSWAGWLLLLALIAVAPAGHAAEPGQAPPSADVSALEEARRAHDLAQQRAGKARRRAEHRFADYEFGVVRTGILAAGFAVFAWGLHARRRSGGRPDRRAGVRRALLVLLALLAYGSYYQFFQLLHAQGFRTTDNYHYYVGSKYFGELGYFGLYECSLRALDERGRRPLNPDLSARRLEDMQTRPLSEILESGERCPSRFGPERWANFRRDVGYFVEGWPKWKWETVWDDHGYHPSPVWASVGGAVAERVSTESRAGMRSLARVDRWLVAAGLLALAWAFGLEAAALAAIVWGTGHLWRYAFLGDAFLRHMWWVSAIVGVCLLRRAYYSGAGGLLAFASLLRIFPAALPLGVLLGSAREAWDRRRLPAGLVGVVVGGAVATALIVLVTAWASGRGLGAFAEFADKISLFASLPAANKMGLGVLAQWVFGAGEASGAVFVWTVRIGFLWIFWRALADARDWEAGALGFALIPMLTDPTNYYYSFVVLGAVLTVRRPRIGLWLLGAALLWNLNGLLHYRTYEEYAYASAIAVLLALAVVIEMSRPLTDDVPPRAAAGAAG